MKRIFAGMLLTVLCVTTNLSAAGYYQLLEKRVIDFGNIIEKTENVPLIDKLTNLLPFAMVAACFKECPGQTMIVLTGLFIYVLSQNESVRSTLRKYNVLKSYRSVKNELQFDDTLFVFEGEDEEDAQEEEDNEEYLLSDDDDDDMRNKKISPKFL
jgi:hypothetical protein